MPTLLIVEDEETLAKNTVLYMERYGWNAQMTPSAEDALATLAGHAPDVVLLDFNLPGMDGLSAIRRIRELQPGARIVMLTGHASMQLAVDAMKAGAVDFLAKPLVLAELRRVLDRLMDPALTRPDPVVVPIPEVRGLDQLVGESAAMQELKSRIRRVVKVRVTDGGPAPAIMINGETGSGKELVARACHYESPRRDGPFIELNCAAIPDHLLESELFGHERGAFTDARERKIGLIEAADGGTLFLDEIGEANLSIQAKLLKVLEEQRFRRIGSVREQKVDIRVITATNLDLDQAVQDARFRADLLYRLRVVNFVIPPLRERGTDVLLLARRFLEQFARRYAKGAMEFAPETLQMLLAYDWPGNVRELRNVMEQTVLLCHDPVVGPQSLTLPRQRARSATGATALEPADGGSLELASAEVDLIRRALGKTGWNITRAASVLGISRDTLRYRVEKYGLQRTH